VSCGAIVDGGGLASGLTEDSRTLPSGFLMDRRLDCACFSTRTPPLSTSPVKGWLCDAAVSEGISASDQEGGVIVKQPISARQAIELGTMPSHRCLRRFRHTIRTTPPLRHPCTPCRARSQSKSRPTVQSLACTSPRFPLTSQLGSSVRNRSASPGRNPTMISAFSVRSATNGAGEIAGDLGEGCRRRPAGVAEQAPVVGVAFDYHQVHGRQDGAQVIG